MDTLDEGVVHIPSEPGVSTVGVSHEIHNGMYLETYVMSRNSHLIFLEYG